MLIRRKNYKFLLHRIKRKPPVTGGFPGIGFFELKTISGTIEPYVAPYPSSTKAPRKGVNIYLVPANNCHPNSSFVVENEIPASYT